LGRPGAAAVLTLAAGFTLLEMMVVVAIIAIGSAGVGLAMRDGAQSQLEREAQRLSALLESARAQSRSMGVPVRWISSPPGFHFAGLPPKALPEAWLSPSTEVSSPKGTTTLTLGPEPLIGKQALILTSADAPGRRIVVSTDGLRPFVVSTGNP
jgi:general secretion pathway protein H